MKLINCLALSEDGTWFTTAENLTEFKTANPTVYTVQLGNTVTILDKKMLSQGTTGKVIGFDRSTSGKVLLLIKWHKDAAPLRVGIGAVMPHPPRKFWMVVPYNQRVSNQNTQYQGDTRRNGVSPAVHRFASIELAEHYIENERRQTGWQEFVLLEPVRYYTSAASVAM